MLVNTNLLLFPQKNGFIFLESAKNSTYGKYNAFHTIQRTTQGLYGIFRTRREKGRAVC
jgi:hypothetical protein